jgi:hypothetical protein
MLRACTIDCGKN